MTFSYVFSQTIQTSRELTDDEIDLLNWHVSTQLLEPVDHDGHSLDVTVEFPTPVRTVHRQPGTYLEQARENHADALQWLIAAAHGDIRDTIRATFPTADCLDITTEYNEDHLLRITITDVRDEHGTPVASDAAIDTLNNQFFDELCTIAELDPGEWEHADTMELPE